MRGRKPKPVEQRRAEGNPGKRPLPAPVLIEGRSYPTPPDGAGDRYLAVWNRIVPKLWEVGLLDGIDALALDAICTTVDRAYAAREMLEKDGLVVAGAMGGAVAHPAVKIEKDAWAEARRWFEHYGLTPLARTRLGLAELQRKSLARELADAMGLEAPPAAEEPPAIDAPAADPPPARKTTKTTKTTTRRKTK